MPGIEPCERPNGSDQREPTPGSESWESWEPIVPQWQLDMDGYRLQMDDMQRQEVWPNRQEQAEEAMARLLDLQAVPVIWTDIEPSPIPREDNDGFEMRLSSYSSLMHPVWNGVFSAPQPPTLQWDTKFDYRPRDWTKLWGNLGLAHTAAVFMLSTSWDPKEHKFDNADAIRATIGL